MVTEISKQNLKSIGEKIQALGREIAELDPDSPVFVPNISDLFNKVDEMVKVAKDVLKSRK
jgi:ribosomal 50S subunit-associated protein YjgA (DUF615 family)